MSETFDPYRKWLGIAPKDQPPNHYRLLGIDLFESDPDVISTAADQRMSHVKSFATGVHSALSQKILNELAAAKLCLLNPKKKADYDDVLASAGKPSTLPIPQPLEVAPPPAPDFGFLHQPTRQAAKPSEKQKKANYSSTALIAVGCLIVVSILLAAFALSRGNREVAKVEPPRMEKKSEPKVGPKVEPRSEPKVEPKVEPKSEPKVEPKPDPKPEPKVEPKPKPKVEKPEPKVEPKPEPTPEPKGEPKPEPKGAAQPEPKADPQVEPTPDPTPQPKKLAVPDDDAQKKALTAIRDIYKQDYEPTRKAVLATKMLQKAKETQDATDRFALLQEAKKLAADTLQGDLAFEAIDAMVSEYAISGSGMKGEILEKAAKRVRLTPEQKTGIANAASQVIDEAIAEDNFEVARAMGKLASQLVRSSKTKDLLHAVVAKNKEVESAAQAYADAEEAMTTLKETPTDPDASMTVGKYLCFTKGDWEKGLPMLALGTSSTLKALATKDRKGATSSDDQVTLGDEWWNLGEKASGSVRQRIHQRAAYWYEKALPGLTGLVKDRVDKRLGEAYTCANWTVIFWSADPTIWNSDVSKGKDAFAMSLAKSPKGIKYLRLKRCDTGDYVIVEMSKERLGTASEIGRFGWNGTCKFFAETRQVGIYDKLSLQPSPGGQINTFHEHGRFGYAGWGFGVKNGSGDRQYHGWAGKEIPPTSFEISVKASGLSQLERKKLLSGE